VAYVLINKLTANPGKRQEVVDILLSAGSAFDDDASCLLYLVSTDTKDPDVIWVQDVWTDQAHHEAAMGTESMAEQVKRAVPLLAGMPEQIEVEPAGGKGPGT
jgi:quinol monooxygenase YgiN